MIKELKVLFVDDDAITRLVMINQLSVRYSEVFEAANGKEGLDIYIDVRPDIVVTDVSMPVMGGEEMVKQIKLINPDQKVIIVSGFAEGFEGSDDIPIIYKPITADLLFKEINSLAGL
ncbi:MAG: hypothetical protein C0602_06810 [Denitrovibrio sp.]|nr:MAG: hypothetical protein C0602_06810 [Denitrovibrio sp.]